MRAFYTTHKHLRGFVFGTPEGWQTAVYDLTRNQWLPMNHCVYDLVKHAKAAVEARIGGALGGVLVGMRWH